MDKDTQEQDTKPSRPAKTSVKVSTRDIAEHLRDLASMFESYGAHIYLNKAQGLRELADRLTETKMTIEI
jgi:hypothetical protein